MLISDLAVFLRDCAIAYLLFELFIMTSNLVEILFAYKRAIREAQEQYRDEGTWHVDMCNCDRCQALEKWLDLPWYQKLLARIGAFITYGTF